MRDGDADDGGGRGERLTQGQHVQHIESVGLCALCVGAERWDVTARENTPPNTMGAALALRLILQVATSKTCKTGLSSE